MSIVDIKTEVRERYAGVARGEGGCCGPAAGARDDAPAHDAISRLVGYDESDLAEAPRGANLGLGCGNPVALAVLRAGETVVDLGSGGGFDCFLAARRVGASGRVIGVDMTPEMLARARAGAAAGGFMNVEFRLGEIENLPVADGAADVVISNCVINLSTDKPRTFREAFRILKRGGRFMVSDLVLDGALPESVRRSVRAYTGCIAGALPREEYLQAIRDAGFAEVTEIEASAYPLDGILPLAAESCSGTSGAEVRAAATAVFSLKVSAVKP